MSHYFLCSQNKHSKNRRFFQCMVSNFVAAFVAAKFFPKEIKANPARIPPQTPPAGGKTAEAGRIHIPSQMFRPAESILILLEKSSRKVYNYSTKQKSSQKGKVFCLVRGRGVEPPRTCVRWHLKPVRLPFRHPRMYVRNHETYENTKSPELFFRIFVC